MARHNLVHILHWYRVAGTRSQMEVVLVRELVEVLERYSLAPVLHLCSSTAELLRSDIRRE